MDDIAAGAAAAQRGQHVLDDAGGIGLGWGRGHDAGDRLFR
jgi:hypothetical protein